MEPVAFLEVMDRHGRVATRHRLGTLPIHIGRAYTNDIIVDDPYVSPLHARIDEEGGRPVIVDAGSDNGIVLPGKGRVVALPLETGVRFRLGRTEIRFCTAEQRVEPAWREEGGRFNPLDLTRTSGRRWLVGVAAFLAIALEQSFTSYDRQTWADPVGAAFAVAFFVVVWAAGWGVANRIIAQRFRFWTHFLWASILLVGFILATHAAEYLSFIFDVRELRETLELVANVALGTLLLAGHLRVIGTLARRRRLITALSISAGIALLATLVYEVGDTGFSSALPDAGPLKPVSSRLLGGRSIDEFVEGTARLKTSLDRLDD